MLGVVPVPVVVPLSAWPGWGRGGRLACPSRGGRAGPSLILGESPRRRQPLRGAAGTPSAFSVGASEPPQGWPVSCRPALCCLSPSAPPSSCPHLLVPIFSPALWVAPWLLLRALWRWDGGGRCVLRKAGAVKLLKVFPHVSCVRSGQPSLFYFDLLSKIRRLELSLHHHRFACDQSHSVIFIAHVLNMCQVSFLLSHFGLSHFNLKHTHQFLICVTSVSSFS